MRPRPLFGLLGLALAVCAPPAQAQDWAPWYAIGPFDNPGGAEVVSSVHPPERELRSMGRDGDGPSLDQRHRGKGSSWITWAELRGPQGGKREVDIGVIELAKVLTAPEGVEGWSENAVAYLYRRIEIDRALDVPLEMGSDDGMRLWLNGELLIDRGVPRGLHLGDEVLELALEEGVNHLLVKVSQAGGAWGFQMAPWSRIGQEPIDQAIDRGAEFLLSRQLVDGSWGQHEEYGSGMTAYCVYCLLKCGVPARHPAVQRGLAWVRAHPSGYTYSLACELLAGATANRPADREWLEGRLRELCDVQEASGLYAYPIHPGGSYLPNDLSNTLYAALALRAARQYGLDAPERVWQRLVEGTLRCLEIRAKKRYRGDASPVGFTYRPKAGHATGSMTTAGLSVLAICAEALEGELSSASRQRIEAARGAGLAWLEQNMTWGSNPGHGSGHHYFWIYGMERVGSLLGLRIVGGIDWYWTGAEYLIEKQLDSGAWTRDDQYVDTILALLFLKRATAPTTGKRPERFAKKYATGDPEAEVALHASGDTPLAIWVAGVHESVRSQLEWPGEAGRGLRVKKVEFFARPLARGDQPSREAEAELIGIDPGDPERPAVARRFSIQHEFPANGEWAVSARVHAVAPPAGDGIGGQATVLESPELAVRIEYVADPEALTYATDHERNLLGGARLRVHASSHHGDQKAQRAVDGRMATRWHCATDDAQPRLEITLPRAVRASRVLLSHAWPRRTHVGKPQPARVELVVNEKERFVVTVDPDPHRKTSIELGRTLRVRRLELTILESRNRTLGKDAVGFAEVELN